MADDDFKRAEGGRFAPGGPAGPGRPKGSRNKLCEDFIADLQKFWEEGGAKVIQDVAETRPHELLKAVASLCPKDVTVKVDPLAEIDDDELDSLIHAARALRRLHQEDGGDEGIAGEKKPARLI